MGNFVSYFIKNIKSKFCDDNNNEINLDEIHIDETNIDETNIDEIKSINDSVSLNTLFSRDNISTV